MFDQEVLTDRLAHLKAKEKNKIEALRFNDCPPRLAQIRFAVLGKVQKAINKINNTPEKYGICENCGKTISILRLQTLPEAEKCLGCLS